MPETILRLSCDSPPSHHVVIYTRAQHQLSAAPFAPTPFPPCVSSRSAILGPLWLCRQTEPVQRRRLFVQQLWNRMRPQLRWKSMVLSMLTRASTRQHTMRIRMWC